MALSTPTITRCCPRCRRPLVRRWRGRHPFLGCSGYAEVGCRHTEPLPTDLALRYHPDAVPLPLFAEEEPMEPTMQHFFFEPGDGATYRVLVGWLPSASPFVPFYVIVGIGCGAAMPGNWFAFDTAHLSRDTFATHLCPDGVDEETILTGWRVYRACLGLPDDPVAAAALPPWKAGWEQTVPRIALPEVR